MVTEKWMIRVFTMTWSPAFSDNSSKFRAVKSYIAMYFWHPAALSSAVFTTVFTSIPNNINNHNNKDILHSLTQLLKISLNWLVGLQRHFQHKQTISCNKERLKFVEDVYFQQLVKCMLVYWWQRFDWSFARLTAPVVNSAFYPMWDGKWVSAFGLSNNNKWQWWS